MQEVHASCARMRDYRGTRRIGAPSVFLAEMTGSETMVSGTESSATTDLDSWSEGEASDPATAAGDDSFSQVEDHSPARGSPQMRQDGLVLDTGETDTEMPVAPKQRTPARLPPVLTAAQLTTGRTPGSVDPARQFSSGDQVVHEEYGLGTISRVSGIGPRAVATVIFSGPSGTRKFILGHGALRKPE